MREVTSFPHAVTEDEHVWVPLSDGTRLGGRIWRPVSSDDEPVPAVLEFIPYRKRDFTAPRDSIHHAYFAGHGYAGVRVDLRGTGESEGVLTDEYLPQELDDAEDVLAWLAEQPWCDGNIGIMGISWGGFNGLQVAARRPKSLRAIVTVASTDDRYADDVHYMGGCLLTDNLSWASTMFAYNACPPDPAIVGERWRDMWLNRIENSGLWLEEWLRHQRRDDYWRHGSVCEDFSAVDCPVLAVSGWADGYSNSVFRLMADLDVPRKGLIGPWSHKYPHLGEPGPAIGFLQELIRWWDKWLRGADNDVMDDPRLRVWMQDSVPPSTAYEERPGRWVGEPSWPSPHVRPTRHRLARHRILAEHGEAGDSGAAADTGSPVESGSRGTDELLVASPLSVGQYAGKWCSYNAPPDLPYDQREEDGGSLVFDTAPLTETCEIVGSPVVELEVAADRPVAMIAARLSDVAPDGRATRVTYGLLNLTHRDGHAEPRPLEPGRRYRISVELNGVAQSFPPDHRIRLALSTSYWPLAWPPPEPVRLSVFADTSSLVLPIRPVAEADEVSPRPFDEPEGATPVATTQIRQGEQRWQVRRNMVDYSSALNVVKDSGTTHYDDIDLDVSSRAEETYSWVADDFTSAQGEVVWSIRFGRGDWQAETVTRTILSCTPTDFVVHAQLDAYEGNERLSALNWHTTIPRDCV